MPLSEALVGTLMTAALAVGPAPPANTTPPVGSSLVLLDELALVGDASSDVGAALRKSIQRSLEAKGVAVLKSAPGAAAGPCKDVPCVTARASASGATHVVRGTVKASDRNYEVVLELHRGLGGRVLDTRAASCPICSVPEVEAAAAKAAAALAEAILAAPAEVLPSLSIASDPAGAIVLVDGEVVGQTPLTREVAAGEHTVTVKQEGYVDQTRTLTVEGESPAPLAFALTRRPAPRAGLTPIGWAALGLGAAAMVTGVALLVVDENPFRDLCSGEYVDSFGRCRFRYNTLAGGVASLVAGAALVGGGVALVVLGRRGSEPRGEASARLRLGLHARGLALAGNF